MIDGVEPKRVCTVLDVCLPDDAPPQMSQALSAQREEDTKCTSCQYVLAIVMDSLEQKDNQDEVRNLLESACSLFPASVSNKCESFVHAYAEEVIQMIADNFTPDEICQALSLC